MPVYRQAICPVCGTSHGNVVTERNPGKPYIIYSRENFWQRTLTFDPNKPFGVIQETTGRGSFRFLGYFDPNEDVDGMFPLVKARLLRAVQEWLNKGWLTREEVMQAFNFELPAYEPPETAELPEEEAPVPVARTRAPERPAVSLPAIINRWRASGSRNTGEAMKDLGILRRAGYRVNPAITALEEYRHTERGERTLKELSLAREQAWESFLDTMENLQR